MLPAGQDPFGSDCALTRRFQSILFHYDLGEAEARILEEENFYSLKNVRFANPDGNQSQRILFEKVASRVNPALRREMLRDAFRRLLSPDPMAAVGPVFGRPLNVPAAKSGVVDSASASSSGAAKAAPDAPVPVITDSAKLTAKTDSKVDWGISSLSYTRGVLLVLAAFVCFHFCLYFGVSLTLACILVLALV